MRTASTRRIITLVAMLFAPATHAAEPAVDQTPTLPPGGRAPAGAWICMQAPSSSPGQLVTIDIMDPHGQRVWTGATREPTFTFVPRDWADGEYTIHFSTGQTETISIDSEYFGTVRARVGVMLRAIDAKRDANGMPPKVMLPASNVLQRIMTLFIWSMPPKDVDGQLLFCENGVHFRTDAAAVRVLGSGSSHFFGYDGPYLPGRRERVMIFMPPNAVVEFSTNAERKLARWGHGPRDIEHIFVSHEHADHFDPDAIIAFAKKRHDAGLPPLTVHSGRTVCKTLAEHLDKAGAADLVKLDRLAPGKTTEAGAITAKAVLAHHAAGPDPLCYILKYNGATVYYGVDSGYPGAETMAALKQERFDAFLHDCSVASGDDGVTHQDLGDMLLLVETLRKAGAIDNWTRVVTLHQDTDGPQILPDRNYFAAMAGLEFGYDGMPVPIAFRRPGK